MRVPIRGGLSDTLPGCPGFLWPRPGLEEGRCRKRAAPEPSPPWDSITRVAASLFPAAGKMHQQSPVLHRHGGRARPVFLLLAHAHGAHVSAPALHQRLHHSPCDPQRPAVQVLLQEVQPVTRCLPATDTCCFPLGSAIPAPRMRTLLPDLPGRTIKANPSSRQRPVVHPG